MLIFRIELIFFILRFFFIKAFAYRAIYIKIDFWLLYFNYILDNYLYFFKIDYIKVILFFFFYLIYIKNKKKIFLKNNNYKKKNYRYYL